MEITVRLDVVLAQRKMKSRELAKHVGITEQNISLLKSGKVKGIRFETLARICEALECQPGDILECEDAISQPVQKPTSQPSVLDDLHTTLYEPNTSRF
ncbi:MAG: helix-turn-helix transcriptional regulator [Pseudomonadota bacterium]